MVTEALVNGGSMWSTVEKFLASEGYDEQEIARILDRAHQENLDPALIDRVPASSKGEKVGPLH